MSKMGEKIAAKRKDIGLSQMEFADRLSVTRQTVSRWENGTVMPDIDKISDIASILGVSCDYLLKDEIDKEEADKGSVPPSSVGRILKGILGKKVKLRLCDGETDIDLFDLAVTVDGFEGNWVKVSAVDKKGKSLEKFIPLSSVLSFEIIEEG
jgi:transcriptional regulator with XRE-family HTH domain